MSDDTKCKKHGIEMHIGCGINDTPLKSEQSSYRKIVEKAMTDKPTAKQTEAEKAALDHALEIAPINLDAEESFLAGAAWREQHPTPETGERMMEEEQNNIWFEMILNAEDADDYTQIVDSIFKAGEQSGRNDKMEALKRDLDYCLEIRDTKMRNEGLREAVKIAGTHAVACYKMSNCHVGRVGEAIESLVVDTEGKP